MVFIESGLFTRQVTALLSDDELRLLQAHLLEHPDAGEVIPGGGGLRKLRWGLRGRGKRSGARVIYYRVAPRDHILLLLLYAKNEQTDLTPEQIRAARAVVEQSLAE